MAQAFDSDLSAKARLGHLTRMDFGLKGSEGRDRFNKAMKIALQEMMRLWHATYLPLHFETIAFARYSGFSYIYKQWRDVVTERLQRAIGGALKNLPKDQRQAARERIVNRGKALHDPRPLFNTGNLKRECSSITISGSSQRVRGTMNYGRPKMDPELQQLLGYGPGSGKEFLIGYGQASREVFQELLSAINEQEEQSLAKIAEAQLKRILEHGDTTMRITVDIAA